MQIRNINAPNTNNPTKNNINSPISYISKVTFIPLWSLAFDDDGHFKLMYASKKYMSLMEKECVENYLNLKKEKKLYNQNSIIFNSL